MLATRNTTPNGKPSSQTLTTRPGPSTPATQSKPTPVSTPSPGTWRHPHFDEITRRQRQNIFDDANVRRVTWNGLAFLALAYASTRPWVSHYLPLLPPPFDSLVAPAALALALLLTYNIYTALRPLYRPQDQLLDIPLTPTQRSLLGLDPNATPPQSPGTHYVTPPRYPRSPVSAPTSRSATPSSLQGTRGSSPGGSGGSSSSPWAQNRNQYDRSNESPFNTPSSSPLYHKTRSAAIENVRRRNSTQGTPSPLGPGAGGGNYNDRSVLGAGTGTPSPLTGRGASVALNSKWLYERGRRNSSGSGKVGAFA